MLLDMLYVIGGLVVLLWSADKFIDGAKGTALYLGMSPLMVGMLIVGFGTSAPEMIVSAFAAFDDSSGIALGNAYGSNIANIGLVLGVTALLYPLSVGSRIVRREIPLLVLVLLVCFGFLHDGVLDRVESLTMLLMIAVIVVFNTFYNNENDSLTDDLAGNADPVDSLSVALTALVIGLILLLVSSKYLVKGAVGIAEDLGVSDLVIGLTVIAVGTSLPELATSVAAAKKGESDMVLGNIIGSCLFNALAVVGIGGAIAPMSVQTIFLQRDFSTGFVLTLLLWVFAFGIHHRKTISRREGGIFLLGYVAYTVYLLLTLHPSV